MVYRAEFDLRQTYELIMVSQRVWTAVSESDSGPCIKEHRLPCRNCLGSAPGGFGHCGSTIMHVRSRSRKSGNTRALPHWVVSVADRLKSSASCTSLRGEFGRCCSNARSFGFGYKHTSILHTRSSEKFDDMLFYSQTVKTDGRTDEFAIAISRSACIALPMRYMVSSG